MKNCLARNSDPPSSAKTGRSRPCVPVVMPPTARSAADSYCIEEAQFKNTVQDSVSRVSEFVCWTVFPENEYLSLCFSRVGWKI
jgi:hypothetical protein